MMSRRKRRGPHVVLILVADYLAALDLDDFRSIREISISVGATWRSTRAALKTLGRIGLASIDDSKNTKYGRSWV